MAAGGERGGDLVSVDSRYRLGQAARQEILRYYNWNRVADQTEAILRSLC
jgi:hypothetical protein